MQQLFSRKIITARNYDSQCVPTNNEIVQKFMQQRGTVPSNEN